MPSIKEALQTIPIFSGLPEETIGIIADIGAEKHYAKDEVIFVEKGLDTSLCLILEGQVKVTKKGENGEEVVLNILKKLDFFGEMAIIDGLAHSANIIALEDSDIFMMGRDAFLDLLGNKDVAISILKELATRLRQANIKIKALSLKDTDGKVAIILMQLAEASGKVEDGFVQIDNLPGHQEISQLAGTSRETVSKSLQNFIKKGYMEIDGSHVRFLDYEKFKEIYS
ncbi:MAG TPA: Crp/Fnr family transcriptional regulator [Ignavibacteriales bacterium]|nr:Crp/Fnr family transcriptional regulator [Ignavibacteriales bacterium]